jgi:hypothetical protein
MISTCFLWFSLFGILSQIQVACAISPDSCGIVLDLDLQNISSAQSSLNEYTLKCLPAIPAEPPKQIRSPKVNTGFSPRNLLMQRSTCVGNQPNFCFGDNTNYCSNCGVCCTQAAGPWCCVDPDATCCPAATKNFGSGCCLPGQLCDATNGCIWPT